MNKSSLDLVPDFRNLGIWLRVAVLTQLLRASVLLVGSDSFSAFCQRFLSQAPLLEMGWLATMAALAGLAPALRRMGYARSVLTILVTTVAMVGSCHYLLTALLGPSLNMASHLQATLATVLMVAAILFYFNWRHHRQSPAWAEARLMALQSRIKPHFLFNSLNSVLALIRSEPRKAEAMLEDLAELFRALLAEPRTLVPLSDELALARSYVAIESIRLGDRLRVQWQCDPEVDATLVPPLLLQPLLENAVRYGVEPLEGGADVFVKVAREGNYLTLTVRNPLPVVSPEHNASREASREDKRSSNRDGNHMALANIKERLSLHFDAEAELRTAVEDGEHVTRVRLPLSGKLKT